MSPGGRTLLQKEQTTQLTVTQCCKNKCEVERYTKLESPRDVKLNMNTYWNPFFPVSLGRNQLFVSDVLNQRRVHNVCVFVTARASCKCEKKKTSLFLACLRLCFLLQR